MPTPFTPHDDEQMADLQAQIAVLERENSELRSHLQACEQSQAELQHLNATLQQANQEILEREREKSVLLSISEALSRTSDRQTLLHVIYQHIGDIFPYYGSGLFIINEAKNYHQLLLEPGLVDYLPPEFYGTPERLPHRGSVVEYMTQHYGILSFSEIVERFPEHPHVPVLQRAGIKEIIHGPLFNGEQCIGMLCFNAQEEGCYSEKDLRLFRHIADLLAVTVANILAKEEILEREREKAMLLEITQAISQINDTQTLFETIYRHIQPIFHFDATSVVVLEEDTAYRVLYYDSDPTFDQFFANPISLLGSPFAEAFSPTFADVYLADVDEWLAHYPQYEGLRLAKQAGHHQILLGKLYNGGKLLGIVELIYQQPPVFDEGFRKLFENFVQQVAIAVANILANQKIITQQAALLRAEQDRVVELAKTNTALKNSLDRLAADSNLDAFLSHVLLEIVQQFEVELGYFYVYDAESQTLPLRLYMRQGQVQSQPELELPDFLLKPAIADLPIWETLLQTRQPFVITRESAPQYVFRGTLEWQIQHQEHQSGINLLLTLQDEPVGLLSIVSTRRSFSPEELELAQALAHQATLALQLTKLAEEAKQAAILDERNRFAREIHDTLAQAFTGIVMQLEATKRKISNDQLEAAQDHIARARNLATEGLSEARCSVRALRPEALEAETLANVLHRLAQQMTADTPLQAIVQVTGTPRLLPSEVETNLLRIGQEALTNAIRHARAQTIHLDLRFTATTVQLQIVDNGQGFDPQSLSQGFGLIGMQERSQRLGGQFTLKSSSGQGTEVTVSVPV